MENIDRILEDNGVNKENLEASLELSRLISQATGMCCAELGKFTWLCLQKLDDEEEEE